jgi:hypothetical protein
MGALAEAITSADARVSDDKEEFYWEIEACVAETFRLLSPDEEPQSSPADWRCLLLGNSSTMTQLKRVIDLGLKHKVLFKDGGGRLLMYALKGIHDSLTATPGKSSRDWSKLIPALDVFAHRFVKEVCGFENPLHRYYSFGGILQYSSHERNYFSPAGSAARYGFCEVLKWLAGQGVDMCELQGGYMSCPLMQAYEEGQVEAAKTLLDLHPGYPSMRCAQNTRYIEEVERARKPLFFTTIAITKAGPSDLASRQLEMLQLFIDRDPGRPCPCLGR